MRSLFNEIEPQSVKEKLGQAHMDKLESMLWFLLFRWFFNATYHTLIMSQVIDLDFAEATENWVGYADNNKQASNIY